MILEVKTPPGIVKRRARSTNGAGTLAEGLRFGPGQRLTARNPSLKAVGCKP